MQTLWKAIKHNHVLVGCCLGAVIVLFSVIGCEPQTQSLIHPDRKVTRGELNIELETLLATARLRTEDLARQEQLRNIIFQSTMTIAQGGALSWPGLLLAMGNIVGVGAIVDNRRKDAIIKTQKRAINSNANPTPT